MYGFKYTSGPSLRVITLNTHYGCVCLISPRCYGRNCLLLINRVNPLSNKFATGVENKATCDSKLNDNPACRHQASGKWLMLSLSQPNLFCQLKWLLLVIIYLCQINPHM